MSLSVYPPHAWLTLRATVQANGVPTDDPTITLTIKQALGSADETVVTKDNAALSHDGTGLYSYDVKTDVSGLWAFEFAGSGAAAGGGEQRFWVSGSDFG